MQYKILKDLIASVVPSKYQAGTDGSVLRLGHAV